MKNEVTATLLKDAQIKPNALKRSCAVLVSFTLTLALSGLVLANPCNVRYTTCPECDAANGISKWADLSNGNAQSVALQKGAHKRSDAGDPRYAPQLGIQYSIGQSSPNPTVTQFAFWGIATEGPNPALGLYLGNRYDAGNNGFVRHMGMWSMNLDLFLEKQDTEIWKLRDVAGTGPMWIGPWWAEALGLGNEIMEIQSTDYSWLYDLEIGTESNSFGPNIILRKRYAEVDTGMDPSGGACGQGGCSSSLAAKIKPPVQASAGSEGFVFEPVDIDVDGEVDFCRLKQIVGADGKAMTLHYAAETNNMITSIVDAVSNEYRFAYNEQELLTNVLDVTANRSASFAYTNSSSYYYVSQVTDMGGLVNQYLYEANPSNTNYFRLCAVQRPNMTGFDTTTITYFGTTNTIVTLPEGHTYGLRQAAGGTPVYDETSGLGAWSAGFVEGWAYSWHYKSTYGTQISATGPNGESYGFDWWDSGEWANPIDQKIMDETRPDGTKRHFEWYPNGRLARLTVRDAIDNIINIQTNQTTFFGDTWRPNEKLEEDRDASENVLSKRLESYTKFEGPTTNTVDDRYALTSVKTWTSEDTYQETKYVFNTNTYLLEEVQELVSGTNDYRMTESFGHDSHDRVAWAWRAGQSTNFYEYDSFNRLAATTQTNSGQGITTRYYYDSLDRLTNVVYPDNTFETWTQAPCGCGWLTHTDRGGNVSSNYFNANKWIWKTTTVSPNGTLLAYQEKYFDNAHNPTSIVDALGFTTYRNYDSSGRLTNSVDALGRSTQYLFDSGGRQYLTIMPDGTMSSNVYDSASRVIQTVRLSDMGEALTWTSYTHSDLGQIIATTDSEGNVTSNSYDLAARVIRVDNPDGSYSRTVYDDQGLVSLQIGPVGSSSEESSATVSNSYDELNRLLTVTDPEGRTTTYGYDENWPGQVKYIVAADGSTNQWNYFDIETGRLLTNISYGIQTVYIHDSLGQVTNTLFADGSQAVNMFDGSRLVQTVSRTGLTNAVGFDLAGRRISFTNSLGCVTAYAPDAVGNTTNVTDALSHSTQAAFDEMNRLTESVLADGRASTNTFDSLGRLLARTGAGSVPVSYRHDSLGRMTNLIDGVTNVTAFAYDSMGRLDTKTYADSSAYTYAYNARGWLTNRTDALGQSTLYTHNNAGQLTLVDYPSDVDVVRTFDNLGRMTSRTDAAGTWIWSYDGSSSRVQSETLSSATSVLSVVSYSYHPDTYELASVSLDENHRTEYNWHQGRLTNVTWQVGTGRRTVRYEYKEASDLLWKTTYGTGEVVVTRLYDELNRLTNISAVSGSSVVNSFSYSLDSTGRRTAREDADGSRLDWGYDIYDQVTSASRTNGLNGAADAAYQYQYAYDRVGNRLQEKRGPEGDSLGRQLTLDGTHNNLNQLTARDWSGKLPLDGSVTDSNSVLVVQGATNAPPYWNGTNWLAGATLGTGSNNVDIVTYLGTNSSQEDVTLFMPPTKAQEFQYDLNGNLTNDGYRVYTWDEENRLVEIETAPASVSNGVAKLKSLFAYDGQSRRALRTDYSGWHGAGYETTNETRFVWNGWFLLAEIGNSTTNYYASGLDLSQSLRGAGGIGGMLAVVKDGSAYVPCFDGNGNISDYLDSNGVSVAHREFDPFGRAVSATGDQQADFSFWFSSKQEEPWWGVYYYGYRYYQPDTGKWLSRDPLNDQGFSLNCSGARGAFSSVSWRTQRINLLLIKTANLLSKAGMHSQAYLVNEIARLFSEAIRGGGTLPVMVSGANPSAAFMNSPSQLIDPLGMSEGPSDGPSYPYSVPYMNPPSLIGISIAHGWTLHLGGNLGTPQWANPPVSVTGEIMGPSELPSGFYMYHANQILKECYPDIHQEIVEQLHELGLDLLAGIGDLDAYAEYHLWPDTWTAVQSTATMAALFYAALDLTTEGSFGSGIGLSYTHHDYLHVHFGLQWTQTDWHPQESGVYAGVNIAF